MKSVVFYVSGHGFGHSSRMAEVIRVLLRDHPEIAVTVKTSAPEWFYRESIPSPFRFVRRECDTGVVQSDSLSLDARATLEHFAALVEKSSAFIKTELSSFRKLKPELIVGDIPPVAFLVAEAAGLPSVAVANFSWDWIYEGYAGRHPEFHDLISLIRKSYGKAGRLLRLPLSCPMTAFPRVTDLPLIARRSGRSKSSIRGRLGLPRNRRVVLLSFGGFWLGKEYYHKLSRLKNIAWIASERVGGRLSGIKNFSREKVKRAGLSYPDLVRASDVVITKPGYGILSECIANRTRMIYTSRGDFREYDVLVEGAKKYLPSLFITQEKLKSGDLEETLEEVLAMEDDYPSLPLDGAEAAARIISGQ
jgi:L-arabinokinase